MRLKMKILNIIINKNATFKTQTNALKILNIAAI